VLLTYVDHTDRWVLADKADQLWVHYSRQAHDVVAAVAADFSAEDEASVAVMRRQAPWRPVPQQEEVGAGLTGPFPSGQRLDVFADGLCWFHHNFSNMATGLPSPLDDRNPASWGHWHNNLQEIQKLCTVVIIITLLLPNFQFLNNTTS
jgi:hypothetical protein